MGWEFIPQMGKEGNKLRVESGELRLGQTEDHLSPQLSTSSKTDTDLNSPNPSICSW